MGQKLVEFTLVDPNGVQVQDTGGAVIVCANGSPDKLAVVTTQGGTLATANSPVAIVNGLVKFYVADTVTALDLWGYGPNGEAIAFSGMVPSGPNEIVVNPYGLQVLKVPFSHADQAGDATETDTGLDVPANSLLLGHGTAVIVVDTDAAITVDIGTMGTSNDPNGFIAAASVANAVMLAGAGALSLTTGFPIAKIIGGDSISYTISTGADTASGYLVLTYVLPYAY